MYDALQNVTVNNWRKLCCRTIQLNNDLDHCLGKWHIIHCHPISLHSQQNNTLITEYRSPRSSWSLQNFHNTSSKINTTSGQQWRTLYSKLHFNNDYVLDQTTFSSSPQINSIHTSCFFLANSPVHAFNWHHRGLPPWRWWWDFIPRTRTICNLEERSQLRADHMVRTTILHVTSAKWLVNFRLQRRLRLHSQLLWPLDTLGLRIGLN